MQKTTIRGVHFYVQLKKDMQMSVMSSWNMEPTSTTQTWYQKQILSIYNELLIFFLKGGWTALMWATYKGRTDVVNLLLEKGADVNAHGNYHISSLLWASGRGYTRIVQLLVSHGAKVNVGDKYGTTALVWACRKGYSEIVDCLLRAGICNNLY